MLDDDKLVASISFELGSVLVGTFVHFTPRVGPQSDDVHIRFPRRTRRQLDIFV